MNLEQAKLAQQLNASGVHSSQIATKLSERFGATISVSEAKHLITAGWAILLQQRVGVKEDGRPWGKTMARVFEMLAEAERSQEPPTLRDGSGEFAAVDVPQEWEIKDGLIVNAPAGFETSLEPDKHRNQLIEPELIVIHYAVTHSLEATSAVLRANDYVSAHVSVDGFKEGRRSRFRVAQHIPFNRRAGHAGPTAVYRGREGVNGFSIGIEIANPGPLLRQPDGTLETVYGKTWTEKPGHEGPHHINRSPSNWTHWAAYTEEEYAILGSLCVALKKAYPSIRDVVGHDEIRRDKFDPGPAFAMKWLRELVVNA
jgi:N-acetyl-anhydromuramyl-L-alanine amidase AmpD